MDDRIRVTIATMEARLHERLTVSGLAAAAGLSLAQFTRLFRAQTGTTPGAFLHALRLTRARLLLERTSLPVSVVMAQVGFSDRSHFARHFKRVHGSSPRALRLELRRPPGRTCA